MSNYFAKYSPDGKWIVFCKAKSFMLLQPDSELYIIPAEGGEPRRLRCNTSRMNSWHSWSPNGKWLVFSSKANGPYTQLFLTHIDDEGNSTPPVLLDRLTVARAGGQYSRVRQPARRRPSARFASSSWTTIRTAAPPSGSISAGDVGGAERMLRRALSINPRNAEAHVDLVMLLTSTKRSDEALPHFHTALELAPDSANAHYNFAVALGDLGQLQEAIAHFGRAVEIDPKKAATHESFGNALIRAGRVPEAIAHYQRAVQLDPNRANAQNNLGTALRNMGNLREAIAHYRRAVEAQPDLATARNNLKATLALAEAAVQKCEEAVKSQPRILRPRLPVG